MNPHPHPPKLGINHYQPYYTPCYLILECKKSSLEMTLEVLGLDMWLDSVRGYQ